MCLFWGRVRRWWSVEWMPCIVDYFAFLFASFQNLFLLLAIFVPNIIKIKINGWIILSFDSNFDVFCSRRIFCSCCCHRCLLFLSLSFLIFGIGLESNLNIKIEETTWRRASISYCVLLLFACKYGISTIKFRSQDVRRDIVSASPMLLDFAPV